MICDPGSRKSTGSALVPIMINRRLIRDVRLIHGRNRGPSTHDELEKYPQSRGRKSKDKLFTYLANKNKTSNKEEKETKQKRRKKSF
jgi:hypothetical protein